MYKAGIKELQHRLHIRATTKTHSRGQAEIQLEGQRIKVGFAPTLKSRDEDRTFYIKW